MTKLLSFAGLIGATLLTLPISAQTYNITTFTYPGADFTFPYGISSAGYVVGNYSPTGPTSLGFVRTPSGTYKEIVVPSAKTITVSAISDSGLIAGSLTNSAGAAVGFYIQSGVFKKVTVLNSSTYINGINNFGSTAGFFQGPGGYGGFLTQNGSVTVINYPGATATIASALNDFGVVAGTYTTQTGASKLTAGFTYDAGVYTQIVCPFGVDTVVTGINDSGVVVGQYTTGGGVQGSFVYANGVFTPFSISGGEGAEINGINNDGVLTGYYTVLSNGVPSGFIATPVPATAR